MSFVNVMIHAVWGTKHRKPLLQKEVRKSICAHIKENARDKGIFIDRINGHTDHLHCLFGLNADLSLSKHLQLIKGESAYWMNKNRLLPVQFEWCHEYYAASVSPQTLDIVRAYIDNQEVHHSTASFSDEYTKFLEESDAGQG